VHRRVVVVCRGEGRLSELHRTAFAAPLLRLVDLLTARRDLPAALGEIPLRRDPAVIVRYLGVIDDRDGDLGAVARGDDGLVGLLGDPARRVQLVDARVAAFVDVEEGFDPRSMRPTPSMAAR